MNLHFELEYHTHWGERVCVEVKLRVRGKKEKLRRFDLDTQDGCHWGGDAIVQEKNIDSFAYQYLICAGEKVVRREWNGVERNFPADAVKNFVFPDFWKDIPMLNHLYSSAYINVVSHFAVKEPQIIYYDKTIVFRVTAPQLKQGQVLALIGSQPPLGAWNANRALCMTTAGLNEWVLSVSAEGIYLPFEYKYVVMDERTGELIEWEGGENRRSPSMVIDPGKVLVISDTELRVKEERWKTAGVVVPVFSLRSENSQGVGDFGDLKRMVDWAVQTGLHIIQLLPIYDTTQTYTRSDSYPYNSISIYALHPIYVDLQQLSPIHDAAYQLEYEKRRRELNALSSVDYEAAMQLKMEYLKRLYKQEAKQVLKADDFVHFCNRNAEWLVAYAVFCLLRDKYGTADFRKWPKYSTYKAEEIMALAEKKEREVNFYVYVQYLLDKQLSATTRYARENGVMLKGDIPIGISRYSVEAWVEPHYFHLNGQAGAPPDDFSRNGQNWGFPTYNWERMSEDGYEWWVRRFRKMAEYFDAYRIDHVLGFFRIWQIPMHSVHALLGQFAPAMAMSEQEMEGYGFVFDHQRHAMPYITDEVLAMLFGPIADEVRSLYLTPTPLGIYELKPEFSTQRMVEAQFAERNDAHSTTLKEGLYRLISNVLFVPDNANEETYHPRIASMDETCFTALSQHEQEAYRRLYNDYFYHRHNDFWYAQAMQKLPALVQSTQMLVCAEDLGMVPACVGPVMQQLKMLSLEIQAMPKTQNQLFGHLEENPYCSVSTVFTHDMPTLRGWWEEDYDRAQKFYNQILQHDGEAPRVMPGWLCQEVLARHLYSPSMLCLISLQDWLSMDDNLRHPHPQEERINIPSSPNHYWRYKMHLTIEQLLAQTAFNEQIKMLVQRGGRV